MEKDYTEEVKELASLYQTRGYKVLKVWLEEIIASGFDKMLRKKSEDSMKELAAELRAYKKVLTHVEQAYNESRKQV